MLFNELSDEMRDRIAGCESPDQVVELLGDEGLELTDDQLEKVVGGFSVYNALANGRDHAGLQFSDTVNYVDTRDAFADARLEGASGAFGAFLLSLFK